MLAQALPALDAARLALDDLDRNDVTEIRSFAKPPKPVQTVCECIVVLKGLKEVSWKSAKGMMSEASFLRSLKEMDVDNITQKQVRPWSKCWVTSQHAVVGNIVLENYETKPKNVTIQMEFGAFLH